MSNWRRGILIAAAAAGAASQAHASVLFTWSLGAGPRSLTLRIGSNNAAVNSVTFAVLDANIAPTPAPVIGTTGNGAPPTTPPGGIQIHVSTNRRGNEYVRLVADSSEGMTCISGGCGATTIPFGTVSWTSYQRQTGLYAGWDIQSGTFTGSASQELMLLSVPLPFDSMQVQNVLVFSYRNDTLYPAGSYYGRVTFTASLP